MGFESMPLFYIALFQGIKKISILFIWKTVPLNFHAPHEIWLKGNLLPSLYYTEQDSLLLYNFDNYRVKLKGWNLYAVKFNNTFVAELSMVMVVKKDEQLMQLFWDLAEDNEKKRVTATQQLIDNVLLKQKKEEDNTKMCQDIEYSIARLIGGLGSNRKSARIGFAAALTTLLEKIPSTLCNSFNVFEIMEQKLKLGNTKSEDREILYGRVFCLLTLIQSKMLFKTDDGNNTLSKSVAELARISKLNASLHHISIRALCELCEKVSSKSFSSAVWPAMSSLFDDGWESCTSAQLGLLFTCEKLHSDTCNQVMQEKWFSKSSKQAGLVGQQNFKHLARLVAETSKCHPNVDPVALRILQLVAKKGPKILSKFWVEFLLPVLLSSNPEKKYLCIKLATFVLSFTNAEQVEQLWSKELLFCIYQTLTKRSGLLYKFCKEQLPKDLAEKVKEQQITSDLQYSLLFQLMKSPGGIHLDGVTHTNVLGAVVSHLKLPALLKYIDWLKKLFLYGASDHMGIKEINLDVARKWSSSQLAHLIRMTNLPRNEKWICGIVKFLCFHANFSVKEINSASDIDELRMIESHFVELSDATHMHVRQNFSSVVSWLNNMVPIPADETTSANKSTNSCKVPGLMSSGDFWLSTIVEFVNKVLDEKHISPTMTYEDSVRAAWLEAVDVIKRMSLLKRANDAKASEATALQLLMLHICIQLLSPDNEVQLTAVDVIADLKEIVRERFGQKHKNKKVKKDSIDNPHWVEVIVEILLSMLSQSSHNVRTVVEQVFRLIAPNLTKTGLQLITDVLLMKDDDLMKNSEDADGDDDDDDENMETGSADDEEKESVHSDSDSSSDDNEDSDKEDDDIDEQFRKNVKNALGGAAVPSDEESEDDDGVESNNEEDDDLSDDAMMRIDSMLSDLFRQRKKSKQAEKRDTKVQVTHFQLRCLDLIESYISRQHQKTPLVLELVLPLLDVIEAASRDPDKAALAERATVILRIRLCKMKGYPRNLTDDDISRCHENIAKALQRCYHASTGVFLAQIYSHCCMFFLRVLSGNSAEPERCETGAVDVARVTALYSAALKDFMTRRESKVQHVVLHDFVTRYPVLAQNLVEPLSIYFKDGVQIYRKAQACQLLMSLYTAGGSSAHAKACSEKVLQSIHEVLSDCVSHPAEMKPKYLTEILKLMYLPVSSLKSSDDSLEWSETAELLKTLLKVSEVARSQEITNGIWRVLSLFGIGREKVDKSAKKAEKRKRKETEKENQNPPDVPDRGEEKEVDASEENDQTKETRRERKARVMKEKRKAKKQTKGKPKKSNSSRSNKISGNVTNSNNSVTNKKSQKKRKMSVGDE